MPFCVNVQKFISEDNNHPAIVQKLAHHIIKVGHVVPGEWIHQLSDFDLAALMVVGPIDYIGVLRNPLDMYNMVRPVLSIAMLLFIAEGGFFEQVEDMEITHAIFDTAANLQVGLALEAKFRIDGGSYEWKKFSLLNHADVNGKLFTPSTTA